MTCAYKTDYTDGPNSGAANSAEPKSGAIKYPTSFWGTICHVIFISAPSTMLLIPNHFAAVGTLAASVTTLMIFSFYFAIMRMLLWSADQVCEQKGISMISYADLAYEVFSIGPSFIRPLASTVRLLTASMFFLGWFAGCILISMLMAQTLVTICSSWLSIDLSMQNFLLISYPPTLLLNMIRTLKFLEPISMVGFVFNVLTMVLVVYYGAADSGPWNGASSGSLDQVPLLVGSILSNMNITGLILSLRNEMKHPRKFTSACGVMSISYAVLLVFYLLLSLFFVLKFENLPENAINVIPADMPLALATMICFVLGQFLLYPLLLYVPLTALKNQLDRTFSVKHTVAWDYGLRIFLTTLAVVLACISPGITFFLSFFGNIFSSIDTIILPVVIQTLVAWRMGVKDGKMAWMLLKNSVIFTAGLYLLVYGVKDCMVELGL